MTSTPQDPHRRRTDTRTDVALPDRADTDTAGTTGTPLGRWRAALLLLLSTAGIALVALGAAARRDPIGTWAGGTEGTYRWRPGRERYQEPDWATSDLTTAPPDPPGTGTALLLVLIAAGVVVLLLAVWIALRLRALARPRTPLADPSGEEPELTPGQARTALETAREHLSTLVDAQDAVIAAWLALERAIAEAGVRRDPAQTTLEFVLAVLGALDLDRAALEELAGLYRRALFDPQPLTEADRDRALTLLDRLTAALETGSTR